MSFREGQRVTIRPAWQMGARVGDPGRLVADEATGERWVLEVCPDGHLGVAKHPDAWDVEHYVPASRAEIS